MNPPRRTQLAMIKDIERLGFSHEHSRQAAKCCSSNEAAVDWIVRTLPGAKRGDKLVGVA